MEKIIKLQNQRISSFSDLRNYCVKHGILKPTTPEDKALAQGFVSITSKQYACLTRLERRCLHWRVVGKKRFVKPRNKTPIPSKDSFISRDKYGNERVVFVSIKTLRN